MKKLFLIFLLLLIPLASALVPNEQVEYDNMEDSSINTTLWNNFTAGSAPVGPFVEETAGVLRGRRSGITGSGSSTASYNTTNEFPPQDTINRFLGNITFRAALSESGGGGESRIEGLGNTLKAVTSASDTSTWDLVMNGDGTFGLYDDGVFDSTKTISNNVIQGYAFGQVNLASTVQTDMLYLNYTLRRTVDVNLTFANASLQSDDVTLTSTFDTPNLTLESFTLVNSTLYLWNSTGSLINTTTTTVTGTSNSSSTLLVIPRNDVYHWNYLVCEVNNCDWSNNNYSFTYGFTINSETFNATTFETNVEGFSLDITIPAGSTISTAGLFYNNTMNTVSPVNTGGDNYTLTSSQSVPQVATQIDKQFYWNVEFTNGFIQNSTTNNQTIQKYDGLTVAQSCAAGFFPAITFDFDDENLTQINSSVEYNIKYGLNSPTLEIYGSFSNIQQFSICVNQSLPLVVSGDSQVMYGVTPHVERAFFVFNDIQFNNETTTNHTLYNLPSTDSTSFLLKIEDNALTPFSDKYVSLLRWYPDLNEYKIVEMGRTDEDGQTVLKVIVEDVDYKFGIYHKNGTLIKLTEPLRMVCLVNPCELTIKVDEQTDFTNFLEVDSTLTFNETTKIFTFTWNDPNQETSLMNLTVYRMTSTSQIFVCTSTSTSFTGTINCDASGSSGTLKAVVERSASPPIPINSLLVKIGASIIDVGGGSIGLFISFAILVFVGLAGLINPVMGVVSAIVALIPAMIFGSINLVILIPIIVMGWVVIHFMKKT